MRHSPAKQHGPENLICYCNLSEEEMLREERVTLLCYCNETFSDSCPARETYDVPRVSLPLSPGEKLERKTESEK